MDDLALLTVNVLNAWVMMALFAGLFLYTAYIFIKGNRTNYWRAFIFMCGLWILFYWGRATGNIHHPYDILLARTTVLTTYLNLLVFVRIGHERIKYINELKQRRK